MHFFTFRRHLALIFTLFALAAAFSSCSGGNEYHTKEGMVWHTTYRIIWEGPESLGDSILPALNRVGSSLNAFDPRSTVSKVNACADSLVTDAYFAKVWSESRRIHKESEGAFDPTLSPLITAWGFGKGHAPTADTLRIDSLLRFTGFEKTRMQGLTIYKEDPRLTFNFSAIAKGYGSDCVAEMLKRNGVSNYLVEIGGEIACAGKNPRGDKWQVSIDKPVRTRGINHDSQGVIAVSGEGVATSGNYRNYMGEGASAYGHTISARTGRPARTDVLSATVIAPTCMEADAAATSCMALGSEKALSFCRRLGYPVMLVTADSVIESPEFKKYIAE